MRRSDLLKRKLNDESGAALVVALIMLLGLAAMAMAAVTVSSSDYVVAGSQRQRTQARPIPRIRTGTRGSSCAPRPRRP